MVYQVEAKVESHNASLANAVDAEIVGARLAVHHAEGIKSRDLAHSTSTVQTANRGNIPACFWNSRIL